MVKLFVRHTDTDYSYTKSNTHSQAETWQINVTNIEELKKSGKKAYIDCQYYTCNKTLEDGTPCNTMRNDKHLLSSAPKRLVGTFATCLLYTSPSPRD